MARKRVVQASDDVSDSSPRLSSQLGFVLVAGGGLPVVILAMRHVLLLHGLLLVIMGTVAETGMILLMGELSYEAIGRGRRWLERHRCRGPQPAPRSVPTSSRDRGDWPCPRVGRAQQRSRFSRLSFFVLSGLVLMYGFAKHPDFGQYCIGLIVAS